MVVVGCGNIQGCHHIHADFHVVRTTSSFRQLRRNLVYRRRGLHHGGIHVASVLELEEYHGVVVGALALNRRNPAYFRKRALQYIGNFGFHLFGTGTRVGGDDRQIRQIHIGQQVGLHFGERNTTQNQDDDHRNRNDVRFLHAKAAKHSNSLNSAIEVGFGRVPKEACWLPYVLFNEQCDFMPHHDGS